MVPEGEGLLPTPGPDATTTTLSIPSDTPTINNGAFGLAGDGTAIDLIADQSAHFAQTTEIPVDPDFSITDGLSFWDDTFSDPSLYAWPLLGTLHQDWANPGAMRATRLSSSEEIMQGYSFDDDGDALISESVHHVQAVPPETHMRIVQFVLDNWPQDEAAQCIAGLPSLEQLNVYVQLYFEHFHSRMPFLHVPSFEVEPQAWSLVFAVAAIGCQYSGISQSSKHLGLFLQMAEVMMENYVSDKQLDDK